MPADVVLETDGGQVMVNLPWRASAITRQVLRALPGSSRDNVVRATTILSDQEAITVVVMRSGKIRSYKSRWSSRSA